MQQDTRNCSVMQFKQIWNLHWQNNYNYNYNYNYRSSYVVQHFANAITIHPKLNDILKTYDIFHLSTLHVKNTICIKFNEDQYKSVKWKIIEACCIKTFSKHNFSHYDCGRDSVRRGHSGHNANGSGRQGVLRAVLAPTQCHSGVRRRWLGAQTCVDVRHHKSARRSAHCSTPTRFTVHHFNLEK
jgi:hypothetical protein